MNNWNTSVFQDKPRIHRLQQKSRNMLLVYLTFLGKISPTFILNVLQSSGFLKNKNSDRNLINFISYKQILHWPHYVWKHT
jgi:hypothetical protein